MRVLDLFCGPGGAGMGYHNAGFEVVGVDLSPQPDYPFEFHQADALAYIAATGARGFDLIHASPPCQAYSSITRDHAAHPDLYAPTRRRLRMTGLPWVIENVIGAPYESGTILCGSMFPPADVIDPGRGTRTWMQRHRNFESTFPIPQPEHRHTEYKAAYGRPVTVTGHGDGREGNAWREYEHSRKCPTTLWSAVMGMPWVRDPHIVRLAIPPAYTEFVGRAFLAAQ